MVIQTLKDLRTITKKDEANRELLNILEDYDVHYMIYDHEIDRTWIEFFRTQSEWKIISDDDQVIFYKK
jgi:hypothetical protein